MFTALTVNGNRPVLGSFSKGTEGSVTLNFATSGGINCDKWCLYHPASINPLAVTLSTSARCYAHRKETRKDRSQLYAKLKRHEEMPQHLVVSRAMSEVDMLVASGHRIPWFRFSAFGSVPNIPPHNFWDLVKRLVTLNIPVHLPVETFDKAKVYRFALGNLNVAVRQSITDPAQWTTTPGAVSVVAGNMGMKFQQRIALAKTMAAARRTSTGRKTIVCPAVVSRNNPKAKCGSCTACANPEMDVVYPMHG